MSLGSTKPRLYPRDEIIRILDGMGIKLPLDTKLDPFKLQHRLRKALDAAQRFWKIFPHNDVNPYLYPHWRAGLPLAPIFQRNQNPRGHWRTPSGEDLPFFMDTPVTDKNLFPKISKIVDLLGAYWDVAKGPFAVMFRDPIKYRVLFLRIFSVHQVLPKTPIMFLGYMIMEGLVTEDYDDYLQSFLDPGEDMNLHFVTDRDIDLFMHLLYLNRKHISPNFPLPQNAQKHDYKLSFIVPVTRLTPEDIARLSKNRGCLVCGKNTTGICGGCRVAQYCGKECQQNHWRIHRRACQSTIQPSTATRDRVA